MQTIFVSHGGGPLPLLGDPGHSELVKSLKLLATKLPRKPCALVVISAHWETQGFAVNAAAKPGLLYDYTGFPPESYNLQYPAPGAPALAQELETQLIAQGFSIRAVDQRGLDHGVFVPLTLLYPEADIPVLQVSLNRSLDPAEHWRLGNALRQMLPEDAVLVGSGFSFHNLPLFFQRTSSSLEQNVSEFYQWLDKVVCSVELNARDREQLWLNWSEAPAARINHPREEHLLPLLVCAACAKHAAKKICFKVQNLAARHYCWLD